MSHDLFAAGLNHKGASVDLRERLAIAEDEHEQVLTELTRRLSLSEAMIVSTCNRVEVYGVHARWSEVGDRVLHEMAGMQSLDPIQLHGHTFVRGPSDAARHIFRVAASLESLVVGEPQILGQVKDAFSRAQRAGSVGPILDRCMALAFKAAKRVRSETEIARGAANVSSVAVDLARTIFGDLDRSAVLIVGAGEMAEQAAVHLRAGGAAEIVVVNRSTERARALADRVDGRYEEWSRLEAQLKRVDIVITSTGSRLPVIDRKMMKASVKARRRRPIFVVDIAVPRDVDAEVGRLDHVFLYNVDDLQGIVHDNMRARRGEADRASVLIDEEVGGFVRWQRSRALGPLIGQLQSYGREVVDAEVARALARLGDVDPKHREVVQKLAHGIMQKLLHRPVSNVRRAAEGTSNGRLDGPALAEALQTLFALESNQAETASPADEESDAAPVAAAEPSA